MSWYTRDLVLLYLALTVAFAIAWVVVMLGCPEEEFDRLDTLDGSQPVENNNPNTTEVSA